MSLKTFISYLEPWQPCCSAEQNHFFAILVEGISRNNSVKLFRVWTSGSGGEFI